MAFFKQTQSPPLSIPASYVQDRAEQIIQPTHSKVEEEDFGRERDENEVEEDEEVDEVSPVREQAAHKPLQWMTLSSLMDRSGRCLTRSVNELERD